MREIVDRLRSRAYSFKAPDKLSEEAAAEIERLVVCIECYAKSSAAAAKEINELRASLAAIEDRCAEYRAQHAGLKTRLAELEHLTERLQVEGNVRVARE